MNETGQDAPDPVLAASGDLPSIDGVSRGAAERGAATRSRHWRPRMRVLVAAGAVAAVAVAGVTAALLAESASHAPSALATVTAAIAETSAESYGFSLDSTARLAGSELQSSVLSGTFDPRHELGTELLTRRAPHQHAVTMQVRFMGKYVYTWLSPGSGMRSIAKPWDKAPVPPASDAILGDGPYGFVTDQPISPAEFSGVVQRSAGTLRDAGPASGPGWTGTKYAFTARFPGWLETVTGTAYVDQQGRVRRLVTITTAGRVTTDRDLTFGDFGAPVPVTAPIASQVKYTTTPYWGFYL